MLRRLLSGIYKSVDIGAVFSDLKLEAENHENIDSIVEDLEKKLDDLTEKAAPKKDKSIKLFRKNNPCKTVI